MRVFFDSQKISRKYFSRRKFRGERAEDAWNRRKLIHSFMSISYLQNNFFSCTSCLLRENVFEYEQYKG